MINEQDTVYKQIKPEIEAVMRRFGVDFEVSGDISEAITDRLARLFCGSRVYFTSGINKKDRDEAIRREFNGKNYNEVCKKFGVSRRTLYRALR